MKNVPKLRFKDDNGRDFPAWITEFLLSLSENGFSNGVFNDPSKVGSGYKLVNVSDMYIESTIDERNLTLVNIDYSEFVKNKVEKGDVFFTRSSLVKEGIACSNVYLGESQDITFDGHLVRMRPKKNLINSVFLNYLLKTKEVRKQLVARGKTATMTTIGQSDIATVNIIFPSANKEQTKIADFLTTIDDRISQLSQKCDGLAQYKRGVMQKIFSQELRFKDEKGRAFPAWEEKRLGELYNFKITNSFSRENLNYDTGIVKNIHYGDIHTKFSTLFDITREKVPFINEDISLDKIKIENYCIEGDVIFADASEDLNDVGKSIEVVNLNGEKLLSGLHTLLARKAGDFFHVGFSGYLFKSDDVRVKIQREAQGSKVLSISATRLVNIKISIPSKPEQEKIAGFLAAVDEKISHAQAQRDALKQYKQGLLQQMFV